MAYGGACCGEVKGSPQQWLAAENHQCHQDKPLVSVVSLHDLLKVNNVLSHFLVQLLFSLVSM